MTYLEVEFPVFIITVLANLALAWIVFRYAPRDESRYLFSLFVLAQVVWVSVNYFAFRVSASNFLVLARFTLLSATLHAFSFFLFLHSFLAKRRVLTRRLITFWGIGVLFIVGLTLSPYVISDLVADVGGRSIPQVGPAMPLFGAFVFLCVISAFWSFIKKFRKSDGTERLQWKFLATGFALTFLLVLAFSFLNFVFFENLGTVRLGHLYTFPFVLFTAYAMVRHHLLNIKAVVAELAVFLLSLVLLLQLVSSNSVAEFLVNSFIFVSALIVGMLLVQGVFREIKQREKLEVLTGGLQAANDKLKELDKLKSQFLSFASHQVKAPMTVVKGYASMIYDGTYGQVENRVRDVAQKIVRSADTMIALVNNLLDLRRLDEGKMEYAFENMVVEKSVSDVVESLRPLAEEKGLALSFKSEAGGARVKLDGQKFNQVIQNLVDNAIKYTERGSVEVWVGFSDETKKEGKITVKDTGYGIGKDLLPNLFEQFERGSGAAKKIRGTGLGLYIARQMIRAHGGEVTAESRGEGMGSAFTVTVPVVS